MKIAVVGCGRMGQRHIEITINMGLDLVGVCDISDENLKLCEEKYQLNPHQLFNQTQDLLKQTKPDCLIIATTAPMHHPITLDAVKYGVKYILCEKPMSISVESCQEMIKVCQENGVHLAVNHQMRFMEQYSLIKDLILAGDIGELNSISVKAGNFGLAMNGTHYFEMFRYITDEFPEMITSWLSPTDIASPRGPNFKDKAGTILLKSQKGKTLFLDANEHNGHGVCVTYTGRYGQIFVDELAGNLYINKRKTEHHDSPTTRYGEPSLQEWQKIQPADIILSTQMVLESLLNRQEYPNGTIGLMTVKILAAAYASNDHGNKTISLDSPIIDMKREFPWA